MPKQISSPMSEEEARQLKVGDAVLISGTLFTARDRAHLKLLSGQKFGISLSGHILYHCGPIAKKTAEGYKVISAAPTTSSRMNKYEPELMRKYGIRGIIGKGGMDARVLDTLKEHGAVYFSTVGGTAALLAKSVVSVAGVYLKELGLPDAVWALNVKDLPAVVTMDSTGNSLHEDVKKRSEKKMGELIS
ncbi:MAG: FumA C-terminus/TtdB family hydratase beta subunit [archaeon]